MSRGYGGSGGTRTKTREFTREYYDEARTRTRRQVRLESCIVLSRMVLLLAIAYDNSRRALNGRYTLTHFTISGWSQHALHMMSESSVRTVNLRLSISCTQQGNVPQANTCPLQHDKRPAGNLNEY